MKTKAKTTPASVVADAKSTRPKPERPVSEEVKPARPVPEEMRRSLMEKYRETDEDAEIDAEARRLIELERKQAAKADRASADATRTPTASAPVDRSESVQRPLRWDE